MTDFHNRQRPKHASDAGFYFGEIGHTTTMSYLGMRSKSKLKANAHGERVANSGS